jgi:hypothetical protein
MTHWFLVTFLAASGLAACSYNDNTNSCNAGTVTLQLAALSSLITPVTTTTTTVTSPKPGSDAGPSTAVTVTEAVQNPAQVFVNLALVATYACRVQGDAHASMLASVGQFTNGLPTASSSGGSAKDGGTMSSPGGSTAGVTGASVNLLLTGLSPGTGRPDSGLAPLVIDAGTGTVLTGYTTIQLPSDRTSQLQAVVGDTSVCWNLVTGGVVDSGAALADGGAVETVPDRCR